MSGTLPTMPYSLLVAVAAAALLGCPASEPATRRPLLDDAYAPDVLVEQRVHDGKTDSLRSTGDDCESAHGSRPYSARFP